MKLKEALKKFNFLKRLDVPEPILLQIANHLVMLIKGSTEEYVTPLGKNNDPVSLLDEWNLIFTSKIHKLNAELTDLEISNLSKFGPRSKSLKWIQRVDGLKSSYSNQDPSHIAKFTYAPGLGHLLPISMTEAIEQMKLSSSASLPFMKKKGKVLTDLTSNFTKILERKDPCIVYTRTTENYKTRNVWGYPFADTLYEMLFYIPLLAQEKTKFHRAALVSPDAVAENITKLMLEAIAFDKVLYSVDFAAFDASVKYQYIIKAFEYIKSCFDPAFHPFLDYICERMYTIGIVVPTGILRGKHGVPSGSTFTNEVDSIIQFCIASTCTFINTLCCVVQGDDGVYIMRDDEINQFENAFKYAGLKLEKSKSLISKNCVVFCQNLYHIDYMVDGVVNGIYPTYRALNRLIYQERHVNLKQLGLQGKDYFGIRALTILENCKHHPLHEDLVRFVLAKEKFSLDVSQDGLLKYCNSLNMNHVTANNLNHQYGSQVMKIRDFKTYKLVRKILAEEELLVNPSLAVSGIVRPGVAEII